MIGIAVGQMGLGMETFLSLTPQQFTEAYTRFMEKVEADDIQADRRARLIAFRTICPPAGKKLSIYDFWYIKGDEKIKQQQKKEQKPSTRGRFEDLKKRWQ